MKPRRTESGVGRSRKVVPSPLRSGVGICLLAFLILFGYAIARPATESLFLDAHGHEGLPAVWATVAGAAVLAVALYNRAAARVGLTTVLVGVLGVSALGLVLLLVLWPTSPVGVAFALYVWKDVHIVLVLEALWSLANVVFSTKTARWAYGIFCAAGSVGGITGNLAVGPIAAAYGTAQSLWVTALLFAVQAAVAWRLGRAAGRPGPRQPRAVGLGDSLRLLRRSSYLGWLLLLVGSVQVVVTLVDYQFNAVIQAAYPEMNRRTAVIGQVYAAIDASSLVLQLATGAVLRVVGLRSALLGIPVLLGAVLAAFLAVPRFAVMAVTKVASKALDYSLFRAAKEMLYIPLSYAEKVRGKALVDMLTYRVAKGGTSILIAPLIGAGDHLPVVYAALLFVGIWLGLAHKVTALHARWVGRQGLRGRPSLGHDDADDPRDDHAGRGDSRRGAPLAEQAPTDDGGQHDR